MMMMVMMMEIDPAELSEQCSLGDDNDDHDHDGRHSLPCRAI